MNTTEKNKLIAEFIGWKEQEDDFMFNPKTSGSIYVKSLLFHKDWNWLMQVVEKIFKDFYKLNPCPIGLKITIEKQLVLVDKEAVYNACIAFIEWYNNQNK